MTKSEPMYAYKRHAYKKHVFGENLVLLALIRQINCVNNFFS